MDELSGTRILDSEADQKLLVDTLLRRGLATAEQVGRCRTEQKELASNGVFMTLPDLMVARGIVTRDQVRRLVDRQDHVKMVCPECSVKYRILRAWRGKAQCPSDGKLLEDAGSTGSADTEGPIGMEVGGCRIQSLLGKGTGGAVYLAKHVGLDREVAVKLLPSASQDPDMIQRLLSEARAVAKLEHENIVQVHDVGFRNGYFYIVMQFLRGQTLEKYLKEMGPLPVATAMEMARGVAQGLVAAHAKGIIHRDLKPENVMISEGNRVRLTDFGLARDLENPEEKPGLIVGTPYYMSPEQWLGHKADERSDLYSLGVMLYQMVTGKRPFEGETVQEVMDLHLKTTPRSPRSLNSSLTDGASAMIRKLIVKAPKKRYENALKLLRDLKKVIAGEEPDALREFGARVKCGFCETFNPMRSKKCQVCGEPLGAVAAAPLEIAARSDEFRCPGCDTLNRRGSRACGSCRKPFCRRCREQIAGHRGFCTACSGTFRR